LERGGSNPITDDHVQLRIEKIMEDINNDFISDYEIAA
jgi:hypothetical protein